MISIRLRMLVQLMAGTAGTLKRGMRGAGIRVEV
jgi:hypothetical protein